MLEKEKEKVLEKALQEEESFLQEQIIMGVVDDGNTDDTLHPTSNITNIT